MRSTLADLDALQAAARSADGVIHLALEHDFALAGGDFMGALSADLRAVEALGAALEGSGKPFVNTLRNDILSPRERGYQQPQGDPPSALPIEEPRLARR